MSNLFENGQPDERQAGEIQTSRFRPRYRKLTEEELKLHDQIKDKAAELEALFDKVPQGRYLSLGHTQLELAVMWAVKQLTA